MISPILNDLQVREVFHLEFLRRLSRKLKPDQYCLKGGCNMRFFFGSVRYSEDMDLDARGISSSKLRDITLKILADRGLLSSLALFGITGVQPPDMAKAKQTETTQRFKIHLLMRSGADLFTKVEYSRRGFTGNPVVETVSEQRLVAYRMSPLLITHYDLPSQIVQKVDCLATRSVTQARDVFDLYVLSTQFARKPSEPIAISLSVSVSKSHLTQSLKGIERVDFHSFRDTVLEYLAPEDQALYDSDSAWHEIVKKTRAFLNGIG